MNTVGFHLSAEARVDEYPYARAFITPYRVDGSRHRSFAHFWRATNSSLRFTTRIQTVQHQRYYTTTTTTTTPTPSTTTRNPHYRHLVSLVFTRQPARQHRALWCWKCSHHARLVGLFVCVCASSVRSVTLAILYAMMYA